MFSSRVIVASTVTGASGQSTAALTKQVQLAVTSGKLTAALQVRSIGEFLNLDLT